MIVEKVSEIQKENRILLKKMLTIDLKPTFHNPQKIKVTNTPSAYSLNRGQRIKELTRVTQENKLLLKRLQSAQSVYDRNKWENDNKMKNYRVEMLCKNADRYCQHPYFVMLNEPRIMSSTGTTKLGYSSMPQSRGQRARSNYSGFKKTKKRKRLFTAGHGGRKRASVGDTEKFNNRPITAKAPGLGRINKHNFKSASPNDNNMRPETVPFTNLGPLGETEPADENNKIKQEITREVTEESDRDIEARIVNDEANNEVEEEQPPPVDKYGEKEKQLDNITDDLSINADNKEKPISKDIDTPYADHKADIENISPNNNEVIVHQSEIKNNNSDKQIEKEIEQKNIHKNSTEQNRNKKLSQHSDSNKDEEENRIEN